MATYLLPKKVIIRPKAFCSETHLFDNQMHPLWLLDPWVEHAVD